MSEKTRQKLFGTDGVRGHANRFPMTAEVALGLGRATGKLLRREPGKRRVVIGKDTRLSGYLFENALIAGLCSMGIDTLMVGPLPTPGVAFITRAYRADAGVVISASHNPFCDNGIKFFSSEGYKLSDAWEQEVEELVTKGAFDDALPSDQEIGRNHKIHDADGRYIEFVKGTLPRHLALDGMRVALDCSNGAAFRVAPLVFRELGADIVPIANVPDGLNINDQCGSLHPETVQKVVISSKADVGVALDGDADRVVMVDEKGQIHDGDTLLAICAVDMHRRGELHHKMVIATVMSNLGFIRAMEKRGIEVIRTQVGDRYVIQEMLKRSANLGGEPSGHLIFSDYNTTGDGLAAALQVLRVMVETDSKLSELAAIVECYPQTLISVPVCQKPPLDSLGSVKDAIHKAEAGLGSAGRVLVRYSGTESVCRVMVEGPKRKQVDSLAQGIARAVENEIGE